MTTAPQPTRNHSPLLRNSAATLVTASGVALIGALWFRNLDGPALLDALIGSIYLFIGIGLYGQSRFTLFVAIAASGASIVHLSGFGEAPGVIYQLRMLADFGVILCCACELWRMKKNPGV
jgi:hypothetical protein